MTNFIQQVINGLSIGSVYALMAVGYSLVFSVMNFSNFAHGGVIMLGAYFGFFAMTLFPIPFVPAFFIAVMMTGLLAVSIERIAYRPLRNRKAPFLYFIIAAMGVSIFLENIVIATIGPNFRTYPTVFPTTPIQLGDLSIGWIDLMMFVIAGIFLALLVFILERTKVGKAIQATAFNEKGSALMGINTGRMMMIVFLLGGLLAGAAGVLFGMRYTVYPQIGIITIKSFIAAVFGGLGSVPGAVVGSLLLGVIETMMAGYVSSQYRDLASFGILIIVLVFRPRGLMGKIAEDKA
jgi:branched-chain amino acid transport system permease protein